MKGIGCRNVEKYVLNHNREVSKNVQTVPSPALQMQNVLGLNSESIKGHIMFTLTTEEMLYYSSEYFIAHNLISKESTVIKREGCLNHTVLFIDQFQNEQKNIVIVTIERFNHCLYVGRLQILGSITETPQEEEGTNYKWSISKLTNKYNYCIDSISYHPSKNYLYLLTSLSLQDRIQKHLWVYDIKRQCMIMSPLIKPSIPKSNITMLWVSDEPNEVYLMGKNYFRMWSISFNEKTLKESNYRNIQRALFNKIILKLFPCHVDNQKVLAILTNSNMVIMRHNELMVSRLLPQKSRQERKSKDNIEVELENSLNQICKMKFMFDEEENEQEDEEDLKNSVDEICEDHLYSCASDLWQGQQGESFVVATKAGNLMTFSINNGQFKLLNHLEIKKNYEFNDITVSKKGQVIVLSEKQCQNMYIINKYALNSEQKEEELKLFWGMGQINKENVVQIGSPAAHERICTLGENNTIKLWSFKGKERKIMFEETMEQTINQIAFHPCGLLVAINFPKEIKLMSILPNGIYEVTSAKTNYNSIGLRFSACGNFLVSNQQNLLLFYNPFTLKTLGYIEPPQLKSVIVDFQITAEGNYIAYHTSDRAFYIHPLELYSFNKYDTIMPVHTQAEPYTCFHFDNNVNNSLSSKSSESQTVFIGCTQHKYMVIYKNYGKELVVQYPVQDCYIESLCVADGWLFAATSKGSIRVYKWPIRESQCEMQVINLDQKTVKFKHPKYEEYVFWSDSKKITKMHKLSFTNKLMVAREGGIISIISYTKQHAEKFEQVGQRKKMVQIVNDTYFITKNQSQKRNRLIEKTEGDIVKIQSEICKQKHFLERKYQEECSQIERNFQQKIELQNQQKNDYLTKLQTQNQTLANRIKDKRAQFERKTQITSNLYARKANYEEDRNKNVQQSIEDIVKDHKTKIANKIQSHKQNISDLKKGYREKVQTMKKQFEDMIAKDYPLLLSTKDTNKTVAKVENISRKCSLKLQKQKVFQSGFDCQINDQQLIELNEKVEQIRSNNSDLQKHLQELKTKVKVAEYEDETLQKEFQKCLEQYNSNRFSNLSLHSEVLKMRTQLLERKQIMDNKQQIINVAFQQRQKLQNYKELVKGSLTKLHERKENMNQITSEKQNQMRVIFSELATTLDDYQAVKREYEGLKKLLLVYEKDKKSQEARIGKAVNRLKELKRYLLLQGLTEDVEQKQMYVEQENLLTSINFFKKRMSMQTLKEKKNKMLKKSALNLVLKQNKNLLEQVNQLREETINHEHQITNLGKKLGEAHRMISVECKLKDQKYEVKEQRNQLEAIRELFNNQLASYNQNSEEQIRVYDIQ